MAVFRAYISIDLDDLIDPLAKAATATEEQRIVEGIGSTDAIDSQPGVEGGVEYVGDVVDPAAIEEALADYMQWANIREMHQPSAAGTALSAKVVNGELRLRVKVVDDSAWAKVKAGVYKGFSIGGRVLKSRLEQLADGRWVRRILKLLLTEISLVDRPANPEAKILMFKGVDMAATEEEQQPDPLAAVRALAGSGGDLRKAGGAADPAKIVTMIQAARNDAELRGDMEGAGLMTQAIALVMQAAGEASESPEQQADEAAQGAEGGAADAAADAAQAALQMGARASTLRKAGRAISGGRMVAMKQVVKTLLQMMADAGDAEAQKAMDAYSGGAAQATDDEVAMAAKFSKAVGGELAQQLQPLALAVLNLAGDVEALKRQPAAGGPVLRPVAKVLAGQVAGAAQGSERPRMTALVSQQLQNLLHKAQTDANPSMRVAYRQQYDELRKQYE